MFFFFGSVSQSSLFRNFKFPVRFSGSNQPPFRLDSTIASTQPSEEDATVFVSSSSSFHVAYFIHSIQVWGARGEHQSKQRRAERGGSGEKKLSFPPPPPSNENQVFLRKSFYRLLPLEASSGFLRARQERAYFKKTRRNTCKDVAEISHQVVKKARKHRYI